MFEYIYEWIQNLACYMILITAVIQILPNNSYRKYIRFFCGLILVIVLASPVLELFGAGADLERIYRDARYDETIKEIQEAWNEEP